MKNSKIIILFSMPFTKNCIIGRKHSKNEIDQLEENGIIKLVENEVIVQKDFKLQCKEETIEIKKGTKLYLIARYNSIFLQTYNEEIIFVEDQAEISEIKQINS